MPCAPEATLTSFVMYLSPLKPKSFTGYNSQTIIPILFEIIMIIFDRDIYQLK